MLSHQHHQHGPGVPWKAEWGPPRREGRPAHHAPRLLCALPSGSLGCKPPGACSQPLPRAAREAAQSRRPPQRPAFIPTPPSVCPQPPGTEGWPANVLPARHMPPGPLLSATVPGWFPPPTLHAASWAAGVRLERLLLGEVSPRPRFPGFTVLIQFSNPEGIRLICTLSEAAFQFPCSFFCSLSPFFSYFSRFFTLTNQRTTSCAPGVGNVRPSGSTWPGPAKAAPGGT